MKLSIRNIVWTGILSCILLRPFISELAFSLTAAFIVMNFCIFSLLFILFSFKKSGKTMRREDTAVCIFVAAVFFSALYSKHPPNLAALIHVYLFPVLCFFLVRFLDADHKKILLVTIIASSILVSLYALRAHFHIAGLTREYLVAKGIDNPFFSEYLNRYRAFAPFISPNLLAAFTMMSLFLSAGVVFEKIKQHKKDALLVTCIFSCMLNGIVLLLTKSVGAWLSFFLVTLLFLLTKKRGMRMILTLALICVIVVGGIVYLRARSGAPHTKPAISITQRIHYWRLTASLIKEYPLRGGGIGNFTLAHLSKSAHNTYLQLWAEGGFFLLAAFIFLIGTFFIKRLDRGGAFLLPHGLWLAGMSFLIHNVIDYSFFIGQVSYLWWIVLGLMPVPGMVTLAENERAESV